MNLTLSKLMRHNVKYTDSRQPRILPSYRVVMLVQCKSCGSCRQLRTWTRYNGIYRCVVDLCDECRAEV